MLFSRGTTTATSLFAASSFFVSFPLPVKSYSSSSVGAADADADLVVNAAPHNKITTKKNIDEEEETEANADVGILVSSGSEQLLRGSLIGDRELTMYQMCRYEYVDCYYGNVRGNPTQTCHEACAAGGGKYSCCHDVTSCEGFTGKVCKDSKSCMGYQSCYYATIPTVVGGCGDETSDEYNCYKADIPFVFYACKANSSCEDVISVRGINTCCNSESECEEKDQATIDAKCKVSTYRVAMTRSSSVTMLPVPISFLNISRFTRYSPN